MKVKTAVTLAMTFVFCLLSLEGELSGDQFLTVFTVVISFYFGTQYQKAQGTPEQPVEPKESEEQ